MKLKFFREAELELKQFENFERSYFFYDYHEKEFPNRTGSMVPFGMRVLNAELPLFLGRSEESLANLYKLLSIVNETIDHKLPPNNLSNAFSLVKKLILIKIFKKLKF